MWTKIESFRFLLILGIFLLYFITFSEISSGKEKITFIIRSAYPAISSAMTASWITKEAGLFEKNNLIVDLVYLAGSSKTIASMIAGETPIVVAGSEALVKSRLAGADIVDIASAVNTFVFSLMVQKEIKSPEELKGKSIGISRFGTTTDLASRLVLKKGDLNQEKM